MKAISGWISSVLCVASVAALVMALGERLRNNGKLLRFLCGLSVLAVLTAPLGKGLIQGAKAEMEKRLFSVAFSESEAEENYAELLAESRAVLTARCYETLKTELKLTENDLSLDFSLTVENGQLRIPSVTAELKTWRGVSSEGKLRALLGDWAENVILREMIGKEKEESK